MSLLLLIFLLCSNLLQGYPWQISAFPDFILAYPFSVYMEPQNHLTSEVLFFGFSLRWEVAQHHLGVIRAHILYYCTLDTSYRTEKRYQTFCGHLVSKWIQHFFTVSGSILTPLSCTDPLIQLDDSIFTYAICHSQYLFHHFSPDLRFHNIIKFTFVSLSAVRSRIPGR